MLGLSGLLLAESYPVLRWDHPTRRALDAEVIEGHFEEIKSVTEVSVALLSSSTGKDTPVDEIVDVEITVLKVLQTVSTKFLMPK